MDRRIFIEGTLAMGAVSAMPDLDVPVWIAEPDGWKRASRSEVKKGDIYTYGETVPDLSPRLIRRLAGIEDATKSR